MAAAGWMTETKTVSLTRHVTVRAAPEPVWSLLLRPDAGLLFPGTAMVVPVPGTALSCVVGLSAPLTPVRVHERLPGEVAMSLHSLDRTSGWSTTVLIEPHRTGARVRLEQSGDVPRSVGRSLMLRFEELATGWLDQVSTVATGFREFPQQRPDAVAAAVVLGEQTATLRGARTLPATAAQIWRLLVQPEAGRRFWTGDGPLQVGSWVFVLIDDESRSYVREVTALVPEERFSLRSIAGHHHQHRIDWWLQEVADGTLVTLNHECATSHVGLPRVAEQVLDLLAQRLEQR